MRLLLYIAFPRWLQLTTTPQSSSFPQEASRAVCFGLECDRCLILSTYPSTGYNGLPTIKPKTSNARSAAVQAVVSPRSSYGGDTSTTSAPTMFREVRWRRMLFNSRVVQPPGSGHPVPGASPGSVFLIRFSV